MPEIRQLSTIAQICRALSSQLRHVSTIGKELVKQQYLLHMCSQYGELRSTNGWDRLVSLGHPANFNGFHVLAASLLHRRRSTEANQTLYDLWPSPGLVHYVYIFAGSCPVTEFCQVQNSLCVLVLCSPIGLFATLLHCSRVVGVDQTLRRWAQGTAYIRQGGHYVGHWPTF